MTYIDEDNLMIITAFPVVGTVVKTPHNEIIGEITGVILNTSTGEVPYALLSLHDHHNKTENKHIAISWEDLKDNSSHPQEFNLDLNKIKWQELPQVNSGYQPAYSQYELMDSVPFIHGWERQDPANTNN